MADADHLTRLLSTASPEDAEWLVRKVADKESDAWKARRDRLAMRDAAIREAAALIDLPARKAKARATSRWLDRCIGGSATPAPAIYSRIVALNLGQSLEARTIDRILKDGENRAKIRV